MKKLVVMTCLLGLAMLQWTANAGGMAMSAEEFNQLLSGNTMRGVWAGNTYQQFFNSNGNTIYQEVGRAETFGSWRIADNGQFCSIWPPSGNEWCYKVMKDGETLMWDDGRGNLYPATVEKGKTF